MSVSDFRNHPTESDWDMPERHRDLRPTLRLRLGGRHPFQARLEDEKQCILVLIGATPEGKKDLLGFTDGARESAQAWRELLIDLKNRGLANVLQIAVPDGALGFWKALGEVWPTCAGQRCWVHKTANVLNKLPKSHSYPLPAPPTSAGDKREGEGRQRWSSFG